jgi:hypothetical protein
MLYIHFWKIFFYYIALMLNLLHLSAQVLHVGNYPVGGIKDLEILYVMPEHHVSTPLISVF